ncbi:MAG: hypothetical protein KF830_00540 [Planctomycetes bacterium]|nr:hypothetical protein [Planctomycetota bacterium]
MSPLLRSALALACLGPASAQDQATTLLAAGQRAAVVVRATVLAATDPSPDWHRLVFAADEVLKGSVGATFELLEPAGACCGRSLFALLPGQRCLLLLQRTGAVLHPLGGARGVLADTPEARAAVQELLAATTDAARAQRLVGQLASDDPRVAADAAQALPALAALTLGPTDRANLLAALQAALQRRSTMAAPLLEAALRLPDPAVLDALVPAYLDARADDQAVLLRRGLGRAHGAAVAARLDQHTGDAAERQLRAAELLTELPAEAATGALHHLVARTRCPRVKLCASEALLANGVRAAELAGAVPAPVLELAQRRRAAPPPFRTLDPQRP